MKADEDKVMERVRQGLWLRGIYNPVNKTKTVAASR
jgi:ribosomal protein L31E